MGVRRHLGGIVGLSTPAGQRDGSAAVPAKQWPLSSAMSVYVVGDGVPDAVVGAERHNRSQAKGQVGYLFLLFVFWIPMCFRTDYSFTLLPVDHFTITSHHQTSW